MDEIWILHFVGDGAEYIVLTDDEEVDPDEYLLHGFRFKGKHEANISESMMLPLDAILMRHY